MAKIQRNAWEPKKVKKKTSIGSSPLTKTGSRGGGAGGSLPSKKYKKKYRGQGR